MDFKFLAGKKPKSSGPQQARAILFELKAPNEVLMDPSLWNQGAKDGLPDAMMDKALANYANFDTFDGAAEASHKSKIGAGFLGRPSGQMRKQRRVWAIAAGFIVVAGAGVMVAEYGLFDAPTFTGQPSEVARQYAPADLFADSLAGTPQSLELIDSAGGTQAASGDNGVGIGTQNSDGGT